MLRYRKKRSEHDCTTRPQQVYKLTHAYQNPTQELQEVFQLSQFYSYTSAPARELKHMKNVTGELDTKPRICKKEKKKQCRQR